MGEHRVWRSTEIGLKKHQPVRLGMAVGLSAWCILVRSGGVIILPRQAGVSSIGRVLPESPHPRPALCSFVSNPLVLWLAVVVVPLMIPSSRASRVALATAWGGLIPVARCTRVRPICPRVREIPYASSSAGLP